MTAARPSAEQHITCCRSGTDQASHRLVMEMSRSMSCLSSSRTTEALPTTWKPRFLEERACFRLFAPKTGERTTSDCATSTLRLKLFHGLELSLSPGTQAVRTAAKSACKAITVP